MQFFTISRTLRNKAPLLVAGGMMLLVNNARALKMSEMEDVQTISRMVEFGSLATGLVIGVFVWRLSKRDSEKKKSKRDDS